MLEMFVADTLFQSGGLGGGGGGGSVSGCTGCEIKTGGGQAFNAGQNGSEGFVLKPGNGGMLLAVVTTS